MKFTKENIKELQPKKYDYIKMDDALDNFGVKVYPSGKKSYVVRIRFKGGKKTNVFSDISKMTIKQARKKAGDLIEQYEQGIDVKAEERKNQNANKTFLDCIDEYLPTVKPSTQEDIIKCKTISKKCTRSWDKWQDKPIKDITELMVLKEYDKRVKVSRDGARLEAAYFRAIWNHFKKELNLGECPTSILNEERKGWSKRKKRSRRLDFETAVKWYQKLNILNNRDKYFFMMVYYTGARASEIMNLEWKNINIENRSLHVAETKNGLPLDIPLNSQALFVLGLVKAGDFFHKKYVFPQIGKDGRVSAMKYYNKALSNLKKEGVMWSPHDARRGFIVAGGNCGCNAYKLRQLTNHVDNSDAHEGYHQYTLAELRETSQIIGDYLFKQLGADNVVEFKREA